MQDNHRLTANVSRHGQVSHFLTSCHHALPPPNNHSNTLYVAPLRLCGRTLFSNSKPGTVFLFLAPIPPQTSQASRTTLVLLSTTAQRGVCASTPQPPATMDHSPQPQLASLRSATRSSRAPVNHPRPSHLAASSPETAGTVPARPSQAPGFHTSTRKHLQTFQRAVSRLRAAETRARR